MIGGDEVALSGSTQILREELDQSLHARVILGPDVSQTEA
jgi:hypothetical protein